jgi:DNA ligase-4
MADSNKSDHTPDPWTFQKIESRIQDRVNAGYTAPCGWLFRGLTILFHSQSESEERKKNDLRLRLAQNTARFAGAGSASSLENASITHVVLDPSTVLYSAEISSLRTTLAARPGLKIPHLVSVDWIEECWANGTLLDEERFQVRR